MQVAYKSHSKNLLFVNIFWSKHFNSQLINVAGGNISGETHGRKENYMNFEIISLFVLIPLNNRTYNYVGTLGMPTIPLIRVNHENTSSIAILVTGHFIKANMILTMHISTEMNFLRR